MSERKNFCVVCQSYTQNAKHRFPTDPDLLEAWLNNTGVKLKFHPKFSRICHIHFHENQWDEQFSDGKVTKILKPNAVPTLYVKESAPVPHPESYVPPLNKYKNVRCAVCYTRVPRVTAVPIYEKNNFYTDFGIALSILLKITSRVLFSRHCCPRCNQLVLGCFDQMTQINLSTVLAKRLAKRKATADENFNSFTNVQAFTKSNDFNEKCAKCDLSFDDVQKWHDHFVTHILFENRDVYHKTPAMTQVDEFQLYTDAIEEYVVDEEEEEPKKILVGKKQKKRRKIKITIPKINEPTGDVTESYDVEYLEDEVQRKREIPLLDDKENDDQLAMAIQRNRELPVLDNKENVDRLAMAIQRNRELPVLDNKENVDRLAMAIPQNCWQEMETANLREDYLQREQQNVPTVVPNVTQVSLETSQAAAIVKLQKKRARKIRDGGTWRGKVYDCGAKKHKAFYHLEIKIHERKKLLASLCSYC